VGVVATVSVGPEVELFDDCEMLVCCELAEQTGEAFREANKRSEVSVLR